MEIKNIAFDLGSVLIDWNPKYLYDKIFSDKETEDYFLKHICTNQWHAKQNAGRSPQEGTEEMVKKYPEWEEPIRAYYDRWEEMFGGTIEGSVQILKELKEKGYKLYVLSNWNAELYYRNADNFPFLKWFDGILLSGEVKMMKPSKEIYQLFLDSFHLQPEECIFIDDDEDNCDACEELNMKGIRFTTPEALRQELVRLGIL